jgi:xanthine phosphoribosyltransferase
MKYYSYPQFLNDTKLLLNQIKQDSPSDAILALARGGLTLGHFLSNALENRHLLCLNAIHYDNNIKRDDDVVLFNLPDLTQYKTLLVVDEIVDSGETMKAVVEELNKIYPNLEVKTLTLFQKKSACFQCDYFAQNTDEWIEFFWEKDLLL